MDWRNDQATLLDAIEETYEACHDHTQAMEGKIELACACVETRTIEWHRAQLRQGLMQLLTRVTGPIERKAPRTTKFQYPMAALRYVMVVACLFVGTFSLACGRAVVQQASDGDGDVDDAAPIVLHHSGRPENHSVQFVVVAA